jgi:predicted phage-related endonuclease
MSVIYTIIISLIIIFISHRGFFYVKHYLTEEETEHVGVFQSKKYDELIDELNNIKKNIIVLPDDNVKDLDTDMENALSEFMNNVEDKYSDNANTL